MELAVEQTGMSVELACIDVVRNMVSRISYLVFILYLNELCNYLDLH